MIKPDTTKRSISQVIFKHTPGSLVFLEEYDIIGMVTDIKGEPDSDVDKKRLYNRVVSFVEDWRSRSDGRVRGFDYIRLESLLPIRPDGKILWTPFPDTFECTNNACRVVVRKADDYFNGKCPSCGSGLRQFKFVWFHNCSHIRALYPLRQIKCKIHGRKHLYLYDTKKFQTSTWRCRKCNYQSSLMMLPCSDEVCKLKFDASIDPKWLRASRWNDPWVYFSHIITFVNLQEQQIRYITESPIKDKLMISAFLGTTKAGQKRIAKEAYDKAFSAKCVNCGTQLLPNAKFCNECGAKQPLADSPKSISGSGKYDFAEALFEEDSDLSVLTVLRDMERTRSLRDEKGRLEDEGDIERAFNVRNALDSLNSTGIDDVLFVGDFPLTYASVGYSRYKSKPPAWLRSFSTESQTDTKLPIYTNCVTTEAWVVQLSARYILTWLISNNILPPSVNANEVKTLDESAAKLWLLKRLSEEQTENEDPSLPVLIKELIHSLSHTLLQSLAAESGLDISSFGEMLLPSVLSFIVYAGESDLGGLSASFDQGLNSIIDSLAENLRACKFDPSCSEDDDGACVGCLQIPRGCIQFNEGMSRAYLFGGKTRGLAAKNIPIGYFDLGNK